MSYLNNNPDVSVENFEILFVDDEREILSIVKEYLSFDGYRVTVADDGPKAVEMIMQKHFDLVFTDLNMPGFNGLELVRTIKEKKPVTEVIVITGYGTVQTAIEAMKLGSYDYLQKPIKLELLKILIDRIIDKKKLQTENISLKRKLKQRYGRYGYDEFVGTSLKMQKIYEMIDRIEQSNPTVLIQGESGTGKELLARVIHNNSGCAGKPFIPVNCGAIVEGLMESELFGHVKGAFTGAVDDKIGLFQAAGKGSIFLDEIVEIGPSLQVKLLRVLQEKKIRPVGGNMESDVDARVIAATNRDIEKAVKNGELRKDLFYRLNVVAIKMPPLRERKEDILLLANHFISKFGATSKKNITGISQEAMDFLLNYDWPGNVRQLENVVERAFALGVGEIIDVDDIPPEIRKFKDTFEKDETAYNLTENEIALIKKALGKTNYNKAETSNLLGIDLSTLYRKIKKYKISDKIGKMQI